MKLVILLALFVLCSIMGHAVHAQGSCPAGQMPYSGNDMSSCGPIPPGYQGYEAPAQPAPLWMHQWGAIATHDDDGSFGASTGMPNENSAMEAALDNCHSKHGSTCKIQITYHDQCTAMVVGDKRYTTGSAPSSDEAVQSGMDTCRKGGESNCHVYYTACSMPKRIR